MNDNDQTGEVQQRCEGAVPFYLGPTHKIGTGPYGYR